jgi:hypothetical protein
VCIPLRYEGSRQAQSSSIWSARGRLFTTTVRAFRSPVSSLDNLTLSHEVNRLLLQRGARRLISSGALPPGREGSGKSPLTRAVLSSHL